MYLKEMNPDQLCQAVEEDWPLLVPAGCIEYHGPHLALGLDTLVVEELAKRLGQRLSIVVAPSFEYGATGYAVSGPDLGTIDVDNEAFEAYAKSVLKAFCAYGFRRIAVIVHHQGMDGPLALALRKAASELAFELARQRGGPGWWGKALPTAEERAFSRIRVLPSILPQARAVAHGDHAGLYETSLLLAARGDLVALEKLEAAQLPWFCTRPENPSADASVQLGEAMLGAMVSAWEAELRVWD